jgi:benzoate-CoA ligase family protein
MRAVDHLPDRFNIARWLIGRHVAEGRGSRTAIVTDAGETSYAELDEDVRRFASVLGDSGIHGGDRVALILPDGPLFSTIFWGTIAAGAVAVPLNSQLTRPNLETILADCDPRLLVFEPGLFESAMPPSARHDGWTSDEARERIRATRPTADYAATHRDAFAFFLYSSGTTGEPKGVVHLQHDAWVCCRNFGEQVLGVRPNDRCFSIARLFFAYGLGNAQYLPFDCGAAAVLCASRPKPEVVFDQVRRHRPTILFGVPTAYAQMLAAMERGAAADFGSVRLCASAGEALPAAVFERWRERTGLEILDGVGSTEACHCFLSNRPGDVRAGSSGKPVPGYDVRIVDEDREVEPGKVGDLLVRGDSTMAFYWNKHEATKRTLHGDWIRTGDKYREDADGYFWHAGRSDDMLKVGGIWVSPVELEAALTEHPSVLECAVVGREDADGLTKPHAFVVVREAAPTGDLAEELVAFARIRLEVYKRPRWVTLVTELPRTATGKVQRFRLRDPGPGATGR